MATTLTPKITAMQAQAAAFRFLHDHLPDRIIAGTPCLDENSNLWRVPVVLSYPQLGILGKIGEVRISASTEAVVSHTPVAEMRTAALALAEQHRDAIEAIIL